MKKSLIFFLAFLPLYPPMLLAWNNVGHRLVAQIAYDELTLSAKTKVDQLTAVMFHSPYPEARFMRAANWPDQLQGKSNHYAAWHYIDLPLLQDGVKAPPLVRENVVWAISQAILVLRDPSSSDRMQAVYLSFLLHFVGDIHQPLHCVSLYSDAFPWGDRGGNLYRIAYPSARNLHHLWDMGLSLFPTGKHFSHEWIEASALAWMQEYPRGYFTTQLSLRAPRAWADEGAMISKRLVYQLPQNTCLSAAYLRDGRAIVRQQIVLAGYRLADVLNEIYE